MDIHEIEKRIADGSLRTRSCGKVRKVVPCYDLHNRLQYEVYVIGMRECLVTVDAATGRADEEEECEEDLIY